MTSEADRILRYGDHADQWVELWSPSGESRGTVVLIHGGYWRAPFTAALMRPLVPDFLERGWTVANMEYRRGADGWHATSADLAGALASARAISPDAPLAIVGHSVGGQLALLGSSEGDAVVALAPVTDIVRGHHERIGDGAVAEFFHESPEANPDVLRRASPIWHAPSPRDVLVVHGADDARVPVAHSRDYVTSVQEHGARIDYLELPELSHLDAIAPSAAHWGFVHDWLEQRRPASA